MSRSCNSFSSRCKRVGVCARRKVLSEGQGRESVSNVPSTPLPVCPPERGDNLPFAKAANLIIDKAKNSVGMAPPIVLGFGLCCVRSPSVAHRNCVVSFPSGFETKIVIDATVCEYDVGSVRFPLQIHSRAGLFEFYRQQCRATGVLRGSLLRLWSCSPGCEWERCYCRRKAASNTVAIKVQVLPIEGEHTGSNGASRNARDTREPRQKSKLVQSHDCPRWNSIARYPPPERQRAISCSGLSSAESVAIRSTRLRTRGCR
jgi:hypothetical protein